MKQVKESIIIDKLVNEVIDKRKQQKSLMKLRKLLNLTNVTFYGLPTNKAKYLKGSK